MTQIKHSIDTIRNHSDMVSGEQALLPKQRRILSGEELTNDSQEQIGTMEAAARTLISFTTPAHAGAEHSVTACKTMTTRAETCATETAAHTLLSFATAARTEAEHSAAVCEEMAVGAETRVTQTAVYTDIATITCEAATLTRAASTMACTVANRVAAILTELITIETNAATSAEEARIAISNAEIACLEATNAIIEANATQHISVLRVVVRKKADTALRYAISASEQAGHLATQNIIAQNNVAHILLKSMEIIHQALNDIAESSIAASRAFTRITTKNAVACIELSRTMEETKTTCTALLQAIKEQVRLSTTAYTALQALSTCTIAHEVEAHETVCKIALRELEARNISIQGVIFKSVQTYRVLVSTIMNTASIMYTEMVCVKKALLIAEFIAKFAAQDEATICAKVADAKRESAVARVAAQKAVAQKIAAQKTAARKTKKERKAAIFKVIVAHTVARAAAHVKKAREIKIARKAALYASIAESKELASKLTALSTARARMTMRIAVRAIMYACLLYTSPSPRD